LYHSADINNVILEDGLYEKVVERFSLGAAALSKNSASRDPTESVKQSIIKLNFQSITIIQIKF